MPHSVHVNPIAINSCINTWTKHLNIVAAIAIFNTIERPLYDSPYNVTMNGDNAKHNKKGKNVAVKFIINIRLSNEFCISFEIELFDSER